MSPIPKHRALPIDALLQDWQGRSMYTFPPFPHQSHSETTDHPGGQSDTNSPLVAVTTVVFTCTKSVCGPPSHHSVPPGPTVTTGVCHERQVIPSAGMEALMQHYQTAGLSNEVSRLTTAPRRPSTNRMYVDRWLFLTSMELQRPRMTPVIPQWDPGIVLEALSKPPYEPLREAFLKHLTLKTVFILAMVSPRRCSELQALLFDPQYIQFKPKGAVVTLYFSHEFMQKNQRPNQVNDPWYPSGPHW